MKKTIPKLQKQSKLAFLLACLSTVHIHSFAYSQTEKIDVSVKGGKLEDVFQTINEKSKYKMFYSKTMLPSSTIDIEGRRISIKEILSKSLAGSNLTWQMLDNNIIAIKEKTKVQQQISGQVLNENGTPLAGVSIMIKDRSKTIADNSIYGSTATDVNGHWGMMILNEDVVLIFSFIGYQKIEVPAKQLIESPAPIRLQPEKGSLEEVVVIGYGTTTRRLNTGSVASITAKDIETQPVSNPLAALSGRMPGVLIAQNNGVPGSAVQIQIRNQASLSGTSVGSIPLYVIDGVPFTNFNGGQPATDNLNSFGISGATGGLSPFSMINPADIERIDVLKDADATAIYGSRGANGVVLITTKKGKAGRTRIGVNFNTGYTEVNHFIPMLNLEEYLALRKEAFANSGTTPTTENAPDLTLWDQTKSTDWQKLLIGNKGHITDIQANLSGGNEYTRFFFNSGYRRESTVFYGDSKNSRFSSRLNLDHTSADKKFNASLSVSYANDDSDMPATDISSVYNLAPNYPIYDDTGKYYWLPSSSYIDNPIAVLERKYLGNTNNLISNANLSYKIIPGLTAKANFGYTITQLQQNTQRPISSLNNTQTNPLGSSSFSNTKAQNWIIEPTLDYIKNIGDGKLTALIGTSFQQNSSKSQTTNGSNYSNDELLGSFSGAGNYTASNNIVYYKYNAVFGKLNYDWKEKYLFNGTFRRDGSSRFGPKNRFGNFGAIGLGWVFSKEKFIEDNLPFLSFGKLRASFGTTGNDQISNYIYLPLYSTTSSAYLLNPAMNIVTLPNEYIKWETTKKLEFALDFGFLKDRILLTANYFRNRSGDQITSAALSTQVGYNSYTTNLPAVIQNTGLEFELNTTNIATENFTWKTSANFTFYKNKLLEFPDLEKSFYASNYIVGEPINLIRLYHYEGVDPTTGQATYEDINGDGTLTSDDRYIADIGTPFYGGFNNTFSYKGFELGVFFQFNHRFGVTKILNSTPGAMVNQNDYWLGRWSTTNTNSNIPGAILSSSSASTEGSNLYNSYSQYTGSDAVYGDASYLKLRSVNLSYTLPKNWVSSARVSNCSLFVQAQNLFTWAKNKYILDTETTVQGGPSGLGTGTVGQVLPPLRTIVFGFNCQF